MGCLSTGYRTLFSTENRGFFEDACRLCMKGITLLRGGSMASSRRMASRSQSVVCLFFSSFLLSVCFLSVSGDLSLDVCVSRFGCFAPGDEFLHVGWGVSRGV
ncbi:hypothetical protein I3760_04G121100 [Carya illinoinensis]|nr:hypothetical protein I3760_04G121100 [Carya illinoinensis]